jgi:hypothetical protein
MKGENITHGMEVRGQRIGQVEERLRGSEAQRLKDDRATCSFEPLSL